jgi:polysaccharide chain length determinant protein (PEP-CTERM system associated)
MLGHRKLNADDFVAIIRRRRWMIIVPTLLLPIIAYGITFYLPAQYMSQTLVLIEEQKVPDDLVKPVISSSLDSRLASMREQILSRSRIQPIIERYNLYPSKRNDMDERVDSTRKAIAIKPIQSQVARTGGLPGFFITFTASDAHTAQLVCADITSLFVTANLQSREASAEGTTDFLKGQLNDAKRSLDDQDAKLAAFQSKYGGKLPGEEGPNMNMLTSLNTQLEAATQALSRMQQDKAYQESMLAQQIQASQSASSVTGPGGTTTVAPQVEQTELDALVAQEADLTTHYTADYPDVVAVRRKIADLRKKMAQAPAPVAAAPVGSAAAAVAAAPSRNDSVGVQQLRAQLRSADIGIAAKQREQSQIQNAINVYQERIQSSPQVEAEYKDLTRDYETAQKFYDDLLAKMNESKMATDLEKRQQGEQFTVMDGANLPDSPTFPNPWIFAGGGLVAGFFLGLVLSAFLEYRNTALRTERDIWAFTQLPTLAVIAYSGELEEAGEKPSKIGRLKGLLARKKPHEELQKAHV